MNYDRFIKPNSIRTKVDKLIKEKKSPINELPDEHTVKDIFIDLEDDKLFKINIVDDIQRSYDREIDEVVYHEMVLDKLDYDPMRGELPPTSNYTSDDYFFPFTARAVENRFTIMRQPKILTIIPDKKISIKDTSIIPEYVYQMFEEELCRLKDYLGDDIKRIIRDDKNLVTIVLFDSYELRKM